METRNVVFVMLDRIQRHGIRKIREAVVDALHLRNGHLVVFQLEVRYAIVQNMKQEVVRETILLGKTPR